MRDPFRSVASLLREKPVRGMLAYGNEVAAKERLMLVSFNSLFCSSRSLGALDHSGIAMMAAA